MPGADDRPKGRPLLGRQSDGTPAADGPEGGENKPADGGLPDADENEVPAPDISRLSLGDQHNDSDARSLETLTPIEHHLRELQEFPESVAETSQIVMDELSVLDLDEFLRAIDFIFCTITATEQFSYCGAELYNRLLSTPVEYPYPAGTAHMLLMKRLHEAHICKDDMHSRNPQRLRNFAMFLGEFFLRYRIGDELQPSAMLMNAIYELLALLFDSQIFAEENWKCGARLLKLTGAALESREKLETGDCIQMERTLTTIRACFANKHIEESTSDLLLSVLNDRSKGWPRDSQDPNLRQTGTDQGTPSTTVVAAPAVTAPAPTAEVAANGEVGPGDFTNASQGAPYSLDIPGDYSDFSTSPGPPTPLEYNEEMTDEHKAAFEDFLIMTGQISPDDID